MKEIVDSFSEPLMHHLYAEIDVFLAMKDLDSTGLRKTWDRGEEIAKQSGNLGMLVSSMFAGPKSSILVLKNAVVDGYADNAQYTVFPCVLGCADKTYEGGNEFPPLPWVLPYLVKFWFGAGNSGAWRFNPCDFWGQPRPLAFGPGQPS